MSCQPKTIKTLVKELCHREGKKFGINIAQMNEIVGILSDMSLEDAIYSDEHHHNVEVWDLLNILEANGRKRALKRLKRKK